MAQVDITPSWGAELRDGFKPANTYVSNGIAWLDDVVNFCMDHTPNTKSAYV